MNKLSRTNLKPCPFEQFALWYEEAKRCERIVHPNAMALSCLDRNGYPDARTVLLKDHSSKGFVFFSNLTSNKGHSLGFLPRAAGLFYWEPLDRQVRLKGDVSLISSRESDNYFRSRTRASQIGAWASRQSSVLSSRDELEERVKHYEREFEGKDVPRPPYWLGFRINPHCFHFWWQGNSRLHDCFRYDLNTDDGAWVISRRYP